jgi:hypothetical protein
MARARLGAVGAARSLENLTEEQTSLHTRTMDVEPETLGLALEDLGADLALDLRTMNAKQEGLARDLRTALRELSEHATQIGFIMEDQAERVKAVVAGLQEKDAEGLMRRAAEQIRLNRLAQAGADQEQVVKLLREAIRVLNEPPSVLTLEGGGVATDIGPGPGGGAIDGAFPDAAPFAVVLGQVSQEYVPGFGAVPMVREGAGSGAKGWRVGLPEKERQILQGALEHRLPSRHAALLRAYFRSLAGEGE